MYRVGFTGTRKGMTDEQERMFTKLLHKIHHAKGSLQFHHGGCIGADFDAHVIFDEEAFKNGVLYVVAVHPPISKIFAANINGFTKNGAAVIFFPEKNYLTRNRDIVNVSDIVIACPSTFEEQLRGSGTWATIRYARKVEKEPTIIYPDGTFNMP